MKQIVWSVLAVVIAAGVVIGQGPANPPASQPKAGAKGQKGRGPARNPEQSPASTFGPKTANAQTYPPEQIKAGEQTFGAQCGFCHGRDAAGGETGPDLTRSQLVAEDVRGDKIAPLVRSGRPDQGMPSFSSLSAADLASIVAYIHDQKMKSESENGGRRAVSPEDLTTGNADAGKRYFDGAGGCSGCHSATGDLAGVATKYKGLALLQRMLYPSGRPAPARPKVTVTLASGQTVAGSLAGEDEFSVTVLDGSGERQVYEKSAVKYKIDNPLEAHFTLLGKYTDADMHNVYAYLDTLK